MDLTQAYRILANCEAELRLQVGAAAQDGDYEAVLRLTRWAQTVSELGHDDKRPNALSPAPTRKARSTKKDYPLFAKSDLSLIKIGWSKKTKTEYEHRAPLELIEKLADAAMAVGARGRVFQLDALARAADGADAKPGYQLYLIVAWWRDAGLIDQHGRKGYSIPRLSSFANDSRLAFDALPTRVN